MLRGSRAYRKLCIRLLQGWCTGCVEESYTGIPTLPFLVNNARWLFVGALLCFSSGFGQTYFISVFSAEIRGEFGLTDGEWGLIYTAGTLLSAATMLWAGGMVDRMPVRALAVGILVGLALTSAAMSLNQSALLLIGVVYGLRFFGQGMLSHVAMVTAGRWFATNRGRAVSIFALGFSVSEATLPVAFVSLMSILYWRDAWLVAAATSLATVPLVWLLLSRDRSPKSKEEAEERPGLGGRHWTRRETVRHWLFWMTFPAFLGPPMFSTALFFHQVHLTETKGWALVDFAALIPVTTATSICSMLATGWLVDRFGSRYFVALFPIPMGICYLAFAGGDALFAVAVGFFFHGMSQGILATLSGTYWPETYGTAHLGSIRATAMSAMVFGTAIGPGITGPLIDWGVPFSTQLYGCAVYMFLSAGLAALAIVRMNRAFAPA